MAFGRVREYFKSSYSFESCSCDVVEADRSRGCSDDEEAVSMEKTEVCDEDAVRTRQDRLKTLVVDRLKN